MIKFFKILVEAIVIVSSILVPVLIIFLIWGFADHYFLARLLATDIIIAIVFYIILDNLLY